MLGAVSVEREGEGDGHTHEREQEGDYDQVSVTSGDVCANLHRVTTAPASDQALEDVGVSGSDGNGRSGDEPPGRMHVRQDAEPDPTGSESPPVPPGHADLA